MASSGWQAANLHWSSSDESDEDENVSLAHVHDNQNALSQKVEESTSGTKRATVKNRSETSEAAVARLTNTYAVALQCIATLHKLDTIALSERKKKNNKDNTKSDSMQNATKEAAKIDVASPNDDSLSKSGAKENPNSSEPLSADDFGPCKSEKSNHDFQTISSEQHKLDSDNLAKDSSCIDVNMDRGNLTDKIQAHETTSDQSNDKIKDPENLTNFTSSYENVRNSEGKKDLSSEVMNDSEHLQQKLKDPIQDFIPDAAGEGAKILEEEAKDQKSTMDIEESKKNTDTSNVSYIKGGFETSVDTKDNHKVIDRTKKIEQSNPEKLIDIKLVRLAKAARSVFEDSFFADPLVEQHIPNVVGALFGSQPVTNAVHKVSSSQRSTLSKLSYLSLTNYADLLSICACPRCCSSLINGNDILDKGVSRRLKSTTICIWAECCDISNTKENIQVDNSNSMDFSEEIDQEDKDSKMDYSLELSQNEKDDKTDVSMDISNKENQNLSCLSIDELINLRKLTLFAYVDASELDSSDPTLWLRVACAARALSYIEPALPISRNNETNVPALKRYTNLEKLAIHRGLSLFEPSRNNALELVPPRIQGPPNRLLLRAMEALIRKEESATYSYPQIIASEVHIMSIHLTRYSWSALGRSLMRACRDVSSFPSTVTFHGPRLTHDLSEGPVLFKRTLHDSDFPSPNVELEISPLLAYMPITLLSRVCSFLSGGLGKSVDEQSLEFTCRAMSSAMLAVSAISDDEDQRTGAQGVQINKTILSNSLETNTGAQDEKLDQENIINDSTPLATSDHGPVVLPPPPPTSPSRMTRTSSRSSSRVRSQRLSQDRQNEKHSKRSSAEYCLLAAIFACKVEHPIYRMYSNTLGNSQSLPRASSLASSATETDPETLQKASFDWQQLSPFQCVNQILHNMHIFRRGRKERAPNDFISIDASSTTRTKHHNKKLLYESRLGEESLNSFLERHSKNNSGPLDTLRRFMSHISCNVSAVFSPEEDSMMLSSCLMDAFELVFYQSPLAKTALVPFWIGDLTPTDIVMNLRGQWKEQKGSSLSCFFYPCFALNLCIAELKLRRCERQPSQVTDIDSDSAAVSYYASILQLISQLWNDNIIQDQLDKRYDILWAELQCRLHWFVCSYSRWCGRTSQDASEASDYEKVAIHHLEECIGWLTRPANYPVISVDTPHLESPSRIGLHWKQLSKESLIAYKDEIQAASIVNSARFRFQKIEWKDESADLNAEKQIEDIGKDLMKRYDVEYEGLGGRHEELVLEFLSSPGSRNLVWDSFKNLSSDLDSSITCSNKAFREHTVCEKDFVRKWGKSLWEILPSSRTRRSVVDEKSSGQVSVFELLGICCAKSRSLEIPFLKLLIRLCLCVFDQRSKTIDDQQGVKPRRDESQGLHSEDDIVMQSSDEESDTDADKGNETPTLRDEALYLVIAEFLMDKIAFLVNDLKTRDHEGINKFDSVESIVCGIEIKALIQVALNVSSSLNVFDAERQSQDTRENDASMFPTSLKLGIVDAQDSRLHTSFPIPRLLSQSHFFVFSLIGKQHDFEDPHDLETLMFVGLSRIIVHERKRLSTLLRQKGNRRNRNLLQKLGIAKASFLADVTGLYSQLLSRYPFRLYDGELLPSKLILSVRESTNQFLIRRIDDIPSPLQVLSIKICEALIWLWNFLRNNGAADNEAIDGLFISDASTATEKKIARILEVPVAAALIAFCGSCANSNELHLANKFSKDATYFGRTEVLDSGDSTFEFVSYSSDETENRSPEARSFGRRRKHVMLSLVHVVRFVTNVFGSIKDNHASSVFLRTMREGSLLPFIVCRILNVASDAMLLTADDGIAVRSDNALDKTWAEVYPVGTQHLGFELDCSLYKAYYCLHGFQLTHASFKEASSTSGSKDVVKNAVFLPHSGTAAAYLYKCIKRAYPSDGKRMPPRSALLCVSRALPQKQATPTSNAISEYIFSGRIDSNTCGGFSHEDTPSAPSNFPMWILDSDVTASETAQPGNSAPGSLSANISQHVWKSISNDLQRGSVPSFGSDSANIVLNSDDGHVCNVHTEDRELMLRFELSTWDKVKAIVDFLGFDPTDTKSWFTAAQCLAAKSDLIRERIYKTKGRTVDDAFFPWPSAFSLPRDTSLHRLLELEKKNETNERLEWIPYVGDDLSVYVQYPWSTFPTLKRCVAAVAAQLRKSYSGQENELHSNESIEVGKSDNISMEDLCQIPSLTGCDVWEELEDCSPEDWQTGWGALYVCALRTMAYRCYDVAIYLAKRGSSSKNTNEELVSADLVAEVCETIGTAYYSELQGGWRLGYPMKMLTSWAVRNLALRSQSFYLESLNLNSSAKNDEEELWGIHFLVGKVCFMFCLSATCFGILSSIHTS